jgi:opacity protein-like surface antigen
VNGEPKTCPEGTTKMKKNISFLFCLLLPAILTAQWSPVMPGSTGFVSTGISFQRWSFEHVDKPLQEVVFPLMAFIPLSRGFYLTASNTPGSAKFDTISISGLSDTWLRFTYIPPGDQFMLHAGVGAPTGKTQLKADSLGFNQFTLSQMIGSNIFRFRLPSFGQGLSANIGAALALPVQENAMFGAGVNMIFKGKFKPVDNDSFEYQAGNETSIFAGVDVKLAPTSKWTVNLSYTFYGKDKFNGKEVVASGKKLLLNTSLSSQLGPGVLYASLNWRQRGKNEWAVKIDSLTQQASEIGQQTEFDAGWQIPWDPKGTVSLLVTGRFYGQNDYKIGGANVIGGGGGITYALSPKTSAQINLIYLGGTRKDYDYIKDQNISTKISGLDLMAGLTFGL